MRTRRHTQASTHDVRSGGRLERQRRDRRLSRPGRGKSGHHGRGLTLTVKKVFDKQLPSTEPELGDVFTKLKTKFGTVLVIVDQPPSIGALPLTVARDAGCKVAYLLGLAMWRIADLYPGEAKTDMKDAAVIADAARTMPRSLRSLEVLTRSLPHGSHFRGLSASCLVSQPILPTRSPETLVLVRFSQRSCGGGAWVECRRRADQAHQSR